MEIEKNIPLPTKRNIKADSISPILQKMEISDSLFIPNRAMQSVYTSCRWATPSAKYTMRKEGNGIRIWRIT